jgi:dihydropteroate synthase
VPNNAAPTEPWPFAWGVRTYVMGIVNVTPDSFSGDGLADDPHAAATYALQQEIDGADMVDLGGESTRPGATPVSVEEELRRVLPALHAMRAVLSVPISIDTTKAEVARQALAAGASIVNDVSGLHAEPAMAEVVREAKAGVIIMHSRRQRIHRDVVTDVLHFLYSAIDEAVAAGIALTAIVVDPGFGFAKSPAENLMLLRRLSELKRLGRPILVGTSRKSTIGKVLDLPVDQRLEGTAATVAVAIANGTDIVRVHDVRPMVRVARMTDAIVRGWTPANSQREQGGRTIRPLGEITSHQLHAAEGPHG